MRGFDPVDAAAMSCRDWIIGVINTPGGLDKLDVPRLPTIKIVSEIDARMQTLSADMDGAERNRRFALLLYTADGVFYERFNKALRSKDAERFMEWRPFYFHLMNSLRELPDKAQVVYRGILDPPNLDRYTETSKVCWQGFSSTSVDPAKAKQFATVLGYVFILKTHNAKDIREFSWFGDTEGELLVSPNMEFLVTKSLHVPSSGPLVGCNVIEMTQIQKQGLWS
eukprot:COSAG02_NODE_19343_length_886_cov_1.675985_1_plen_225_part_00